MQTRRAILSAGVVGVLAGVAMTAEPPPPEYVKAMRDIRASMDSAAKAVEASDFEAVVKHAALVEDAFTYVEGYWTGKAEDAVRWSKIAGKAASDLGSAATVPSLEGIAFSSKELTDTCAACHAAHRERLPDGSFQIK
jgi:hypothetical protein